jgi:hypothetical protein
VIRLRLVVNRRRVRAIAVASLGALAIGWALMAGLDWLLRTPAPDAVGVEAEAVPTPAPVAAAAGPKIKATLYFAAEDGMRLVPTPSEVPLAQGPVAQARAILVAQLTASAPPGLAPTIPPGTTLRGLFISSTNEAFVDLDPSVRSAHPGGTLDELLTVYTIVNVLLTNMPSVRQVQILIDGREVDTLAGHVDLRRPLRKNDALVVSDQ